MGLSAQVVEETKFPSHWVQLIKECVTTVQYSVAVNGQTSNPFRMQCGLRQGDPLFPILFALCTEALSSTLLHSQAMKNLKGVFIDKGGLGFKHLHHFNLALLSRSGWRILRHPTSPLSSMLKSKNETIFKKADPRATNGPGHAVKLTMEWLNHAVVGILRYILVCLMTNNPNGFLIFSLKATEQSLKAIVSLPIAMAILVSWTLLRPSH
ncbi:hypothetical protein LIER_32016 [Lithospermum erythrorhizon]|uniref:Reverse transcriptase domain-containing protein n=1 Tax=Lithospermum erythrorhizon TaxID=34254 RepID=A0AAV3RSR2_LITER